MNFNRHILALSLCSLGLLSTAAVDAQPTPHHRHGIFVSIDGMNPSLLGPLHDAGMLNHKHGLGWLMDHSLNAPKAWPVVTTLTAASHVSTITCTPPSRHGISANSFLKGGQKVSGFMADFKSEPLWRAASRQGYKTLALAYVGADGKTPERTADFGLAYPDDGLLGPPQTLSFDPQTLVAAQGWTLTSDLASRTDLKETTIGLTLNPKTGETATVQVLIDLAGATPELYFDADKDLTNGSFGKAHYGETKVVDFFFIETNPASTVKGVKRRAFARLLPRSDASLPVYVSKTTFNNAYPASFREQLDGANMVWPDYGIRSDKITAHESLEAQAMIDRFLTDVATTYAPILGADVILFYQPLIDTIGHKYQSALPMPFNPQATDDVTQSLVEAFKIIDENMSRLFSLAKPRDVIELMGDHGMDPSIKVVNLAALLPRDQIGRMEVITSGSLAMLYPPVTDASPEAAAAADLLGQNLRDALANVSFNGQPALGESQRKSDPLPYNTRRFGDEWHYGEAIWGITAASGFWFQYNPLSDQVLIDPPALGMHGQALSVPTMATSLFIKGPGVHHGKIAEASLIDAVPTFADLMGFDPPADCLGQSLVGHHAKK